MKARSSLSQIEERLRRAFGLAGEIGLELDSAKMAPVVIAADLRDPGLSPERGRYFTAVKGPSLAGVGATAWTVLFRRDVIIESIVLSAVANVSDLYVVEHLIPGVAPSNAPIQLGGLWTDFRTTTGDRPPIFETNGFVADGAPFINDLSRVAGFSGLGAGAFYAQTHVKWHLLAGSHLNFAQSVAASRQICWMFTGRTV